MYPIIKRVLDIIFSLLLLPIGLLFFLFVGIAIKLEDNGSIFYNALRIGKNKKAFRMFKFRSMKINAPDIRLEDGSTYNSADDPRVTKVGKFIRKTSIDEIPQLLNILIGNMSFVGPRPDSVNWINNYTEDESIIHNVRPGVTGYNQALNRNAVGTKEKLKNDVIYVEKMSLIFDIKIILLTIKSVLGQKNVYRGGSIEKNNDIGS